ncbi:DUF2637 domain-containing protein [Streptomyces tirandamycinicus]|uniref:DUF2637 domain-containing protein n=1 Tax=Streptomyces tirandamycinicus TaxID=2174846 RepID=UPI001FC9BB45|nr:DUF2637 domain-containing protein [Streptomyces tirandamycinicus]
MRHYQGKAADPPRAAPASEDSRRVPQLTRVHHLLIGVVIVGAVIISGIGFAGSYTAVRKLAQEEGFGDFAYWFPIGVDAGIVVLLALDLLLTWLRIPFPLLRQTAWLLTAATIAFNAASAWPDPLGVGMHAVIPILFVVAVEAARHAVGRLADITADKHMEGVRFTRWLLAPVPTFRLWRRMKLWELRSYEQVIKMEQDRLIYQARLQNRFGRGWRRKAPVEALMPLRLARYGVPLAETAPTGLAAAGITLPASLERLDARPELPAVPQQTDAEPLDGGSAEHEQYEAELEEIAGHPEPTPAPLVDGYSFEQFERDDQQLAGAGAVAARRDGRPQMVQARIGGEWFRKDPGPAEEAAASLSPIGDTAESVDVAVPSESADEPPDSAPELTGVDLLEYRYLQLSPEERAQSASALARALHPGTGFTEGTARKYLRPIIAKHGS